MTQIILLFAFGCLIGFTLGLLGGGGSILTVPLLVYIFGVGVYSAIGTSLAIVGTTAIIGAITHSRRGNVKFKSGFAFGVMAMIGAIPGAWFSHLVGEKMILVLFALLMIFVGLRMLLTEKSHLSNEAGTHTDLHISRATLVLMSMGFVVGVLTGFFGVGGGFLIVPALVLVGNFPIHQAVGTSLLIIAMASVSGFVGHLSLVNLNFLIITYFVIGSIVGVILGTTSSSRIPEKRLTQSFGLFIIIISLYLFYQNLF
jgi:uncharacterized membrane protein YfcA